MGSEANSNSYYLTQTPELRAMDTRYGKIIPNRIFIGGLAKDTTEDDLELAFAGYGPVKSAKIILDRHGVSKGYGFVTFQNINDAQRVQKELDFIFIKDVKIKVSQAVRKQNVINIPQYYSHPYATGPPHMGYPEPNPHMYYQHPMQYPPFCPYNGMPPMGMPLYWQPYY